MGGGGELVQFDIFRESPGYKYNTCTDVFTDEADCSFQKSVSLWRSIIASEKFEFCIMFSDGMYNTKCTVSET